MDTLAFFVCLSIATIYSRNHEMLLSKDYYVAEIGQPHHMAGYHFNVLFYSFAM